MTIEEYKNKPYKTDGNCNIITNGDIWFDLPRKGRRMIERIINKGKYPGFIEDYFIED